MSRLGQLALQGALQAVAVQESGERVRHGHLARGLCASAKVVGALAQTVALALESDGDGDAREEFFDAEGLRDVVVRA